MRSHQLRRFSSSCKVFTEHYKMKCQVSILKDYFSAGWGWTWSEQTLVQKKNWKLFFNTNTGCEHFLWYCLTTKLPIWSIYSHTDKHSCSNLANLMIFAMQAPDVYFEMRWKTFILILVAIKSITRMTGLKSFVWSQCLIPVFP